MIKIEKWNINEDDHVLDVAISGQNNQASYSFESGRKTDSPDLQKKEQNRILKKMDIVSNRYKKYLSIAEKFMNKELSGRVVDMGAGRGTFAGVASIHNDVIEVFAVEYSAGFVENVMPVCLERMGAKSEKITGCIGSFNNTKFNDNSVDFVLEGGAYHHSEDIQKTISETFRILKPGGWFIGIDRSHPNHITEVELNKFRFKELSVSQKENYGLPIDKSFTRADWGEHEYRECDWLHFFSSQGFESHLIRFRSVSKRSFRSILKLLFFYAFGNFLISRKVSTIPYTVWFGEPGRTLIMCKKPN